MEENTPDNEEQDTQDSVVSPNKRAEANRRNARLSTGPRTEEGKSWSRRNAVKHGVLASAVLITEGESREDAAKFQELLDALHEDLAPVGRLEEMQVEKIAVCWWRQSRALRCEAGLIRRAFAKAAGEEYDQILNPAGATIRDHLRLPLEADLDRILRYETTIQRQLVCAFNQLERLQRFRKGDPVPAPVSLQISSDQ